MSVTRGSAITQADMDALATLANAKMGAFLTSIGARNFDFSYLDSAILPPGNVQGVINYGSGGYTATDSQGGLFLVIWVWSFKTISGRRHYSSRPETGRVRFNTSGAALNVDWSWTAPAGGADGYIVVVGGDGAGTSLLYTNFQYWQELSAAAFNDDGSTGWIWVEDIGGTLDVFNPVTGGPWQRELHLMKRLLFGELGSTPWTPDETWLVSGPWCVAVGPRLVNGDATKASYRDIEFWYAADAHSGDVTVTTELNGSVVATTTLTPTSVTAIHPSSAGKKVTFGNLNLTHGSGTLALHADGIDGVWVAKTKPVFCVNTYLEAELPQYGLDQSSPFGLMPGPRAAVPASSPPEINPIVPAVAARPSLWPVFRDTDYLLWQSNVGGVSAKPVPFFNNGYFSTPAAITLAPGAVWSASIFLPINHTQSKIDAAATALPIYFSQSGTPDPDNPATYDGFVASPLRMPADYSPTLGSDVFYTVKNNTAAPVTFTIRTSIFTSIGSYNPGDLPVFFRRHIGTSSDPNNGRGAIEQYSYNFSSPKNSGAGRKSEIPLSGYCIYEIKVQRNAQGNPGTIPGAGTAALDVTIGFMRGTTSEAAGTFEAIQTFTIAANQSSVTAAVFWPVLAGAALAYQCTEPVDIFCQVNFQPAFISRFVVTTLSAPNIWGTHSGDPINSNQCLRFLNVTSTNGDTHVTFPACATVYNDLEALLGLL